MDSKQVQSESADRLSTFRGVVVARLSFARRLETHLQLPLVSVSSRSRQRDDRSWHDDLVQDDAFLLHVLENNRSCNWLDRNFDRLCRLLLPLDCLTSFVDRQAVVVFDAEMSRR